MASFFNTRDLPKFRLTPAICHLTPAVRPGSAKCGAQKITRIDWLLCPIYETFLPKTVFILRHGDSFIFFEKLSSLKDWNAECVHNSVV